MPLLLHVCVVIPYSGRLSTPFGMCGVHQRGVGTQERNVNTQNLFLFALLANALLNGIKRFEQGIGTTIVTTTTTVNRLTAKHTALPVQYSSRNLAGKWLVPQLEKRNGITHVLSRGSCPSPSGSRFPVCCPAPTLATAMSEPTLGEKMQEHLGSFSRQILHLQLHLLPRLPSATKQQKKKLCLFGG